ncbi:hypothetical protein ABTZ59_36870 [Streptomyces sp. NPDC094034]|uniref:hypothetical protein n=1 Tax=Streptomyces sp. NPDC094034 TaxID=3155309 RepID=UPI00332AD238
MTGDGYPIGGTGQVKGDPVRYVKNASTGNRYHIGSYIGTNGKAITTPGKKSPQVAQAQARAKAAEQAQADARAAAQAKAAKDKANAERRKKDGIWGNIKAGEFGAAWDNAKGTTAGQWVGNHWENIKTHSGIVGFGVCVVASAGTCIAVGAGIAAAKFLGDGVGYGEWNGRALAKDLAWVAVGGGAAATYGRVFGGQASWSAAHSAGAIAKIPRVYRTKVPGVRGVGGGRKSSVTAENPGGAIDWGTTYGNMGTNAGLNTAFCSSGSASLGAYVGAC